MGTLRRKLQGSRIHGPNHVKFDKSQWLALLQDPDIDEEDSNLIACGLYFDNLLSYIRSIIRIDNLSLMPGSIMRLLLAMQARELESVRLQSAPNPLDISSKIPVFPNRSLEQMIELETGNAFSADELITGMADGFKHIFSRLINEPSEIQQSTKRSEYAINAEIFNILVRESNVACVYNIAVSYWQDCLGNGYQISAEEGSTILSPIDPTLDAALVASLYRRDRLAVEALGLFSAQWDGEFTFEQKEFLTGIIPVGNIVMHKDKIIKINLVSNVNTLNELCYSVWTTLEIQSEHYDEISKIELPEYYNFTLLELHKGWLFLQSLAICLTKRLPNKGIRHLQELLDYAPVVNRKIMNDAIANSLGISVDRANLLLSVFTFNGKNNQELWTQPLLLHKSGYIMSLPCLTTGRLIYLSEAWMRQGGLDFTKKGPVFESYVIAFLNNVLKSSPLKDVAMVVSRPMKFATQNGKKEEVDLILIINRTVLICEVKCILWPTNAIQYANYRNTLQGAAEQASRKELAAKNNLASFSKELLRLGYNCPENPEIISCILSNSAVYAGFKIDNTPVVDLHILRKYFDNKFVPIAIRYKGKTKEIRSVEFYSDSNSAGSALFSYLNNPPQLESVKNSMQPRTTKFPIENQKFGPLIYETSRVISDVDTLMSDADVVNSNLFLKSQDKEAGLLGAVVG